MEALIHKFSCEADKCFWLQGKFREGVMDRVGRLEKAAGISNFHLFCIFLQNLLSIQLINFRWLGGW